MNDIAFIERFIAFEARFDSFLEQYKKDSNGTGFRRCVNRLDRLEVVEKLVDRMQSRHMWLQNTVIAAIIGFVFREWLFK